MNGSMQGEPFLPYPGLRVSAGDPGATPGTDASRAVDVLDPAGMPSPNIIDPGATFGLTVFFRVALGGIAFPLPATLSVNFHVINIRTGAEVAGSPFPGTAPATAARAGDHGQDGPFDVISWFSSTTVAPIALGQGTYRILVHGHETVAGLMFFHEGTVVHVGI